MAPPYSSPSSPWRCPTLPLPPHGAALPFPFLPMAPPLSCPSSYGVALLLHFLPIVDVADVDGGAKDDGLAGVQGGMCGVAKNDGQHTTASSPIVTLLPPLPDPISGQRHHTRPKMVVEGDAAPTRRG
ncbi:uncharacterized protein LOC119344598 [Triticum dicoccoides]|uniref:uncharacterized protein LOC119344598 n=1 Tax=Triticum dicoccoides TaxID=85692 RepID=UPI00188E4893|nr:uncharacterized protein LOC119344598 [Triticum dicoccoides]